VPDLFSQDAADLADDARRLLVELDRDVPGAARLSGECRPPLDVLETSAHIEIVVDLPGVPPEAIRIALRRQTLLIVGVKQAGATDTSGRFHVAERSYGRFARAVRLTAAIDASRGRARVESGQLHVLLPRIEDRRGRVIDIPIDPRVAG
jgi:HSP20 family protein